MPSTDATKPQRRPYEARRETRDLHWESEAAWGRYQERLGNLTANEEAAIRRAFITGWMTRDRELAGNGVALCG